MPAHRLQCQEQGSRAAVCNSLQHILLYKAPIDGAVAWSLGVLAAHMPSSNLKEGDCVWPELCTEVHCRPYDWCTRGLM